MNKYNYNSYFLFSLLVGVFFSLFFVVAEENQTNTTVPESPFDISNTTEENITETTQGNETEEWSENEEEQEINEEEEVENESLETTLEETNTTSESNASTENATVSIICNESECDEGCTQCSDGSCHKPEEICTKAAVIEKITPATIKKGEEQLNIVVRNTGNLVLQNIEAQVTGYGITTQETLSIETLLAGEKDYTFTKISAEQSGTIDLVVKIYVNGSLLVQDIVQLSVLEDAVVEVVEEINTFNKTEAAQQLNETRNQFNTVEKKYYEKEKQDYLVYGMDKDLDGVKEYLRLAQVAIIEEEQKEFEKNILAAKSALETIEAELNEAQKEQKTILELLSENLALIGSLLGVLISAITVWSMTKVHLKKAKIVNIIKGKQILNVDKDTEVRNIIEDEKETKDL